MLLYCCGAVLLFAGVLLVYRVGVLLFYRFGVVGKVFRCLLGLMRCRFVVADVLLFSVLCCCVVLLC